MVHQLVKNPAVTQIDVVDREPDVIRLVQPLLPADPRIHVHCDDFYAWCDRASMDPNYFPGTVIWDLAVGTGGKISEGKEIPIARYLIAAKFGELRFDPETRGWVKRTDWKEFDIFIHGIDRDPVGEEFAKTPEFRRVHRIMRGKPEALCPK